MAKKDDKTLPMFPDLEARIASDKSERLLGFLNEGVDYFQAPTTKATSHHRRRILAKYFPTFSDYGKRAVSKQDNATVASTYNNVYKYYLQKALGGIVAGAAEDRRR